MKIHCAFDEIVDIGLLRPNPLNPNVHPEDQIKKLARILKYFGWRRSITVSRLSGLVVRGHGRLDAAKLAGLKEAPVDYQDYENEDQELADLVADNKIAEGSELNDILTGEILDVLGGAGFDLELTGFDMGELEKGRGTGPDGTGGGRTHRIITQLPYVYKKAERDRIMEILNRGKDCFGVDDPGQVLLRVCKQGEA